MPAQKQGLLIPDAVEPATVLDGASSTFVRNMALPVHRWFRYSAGFSAEWVEQVIRDRRERGEVRVFDPFAGSATTLLAAEDLGIETLGIDAHPFVCRIARAKLDRRSNPDSYLAKVKELRRAARQCKPQTSGYPSLIYKCYDEAALADLDCLRQALLKIADESPAFRLAWLTLVSILRKTSKAGTAQWQYVLPKKAKRAPQDVFSAFDETTRVFHRDMLMAQELSGPPAEFAEVDARTCAGVPPNWNLIITSPPYPNNFDYADATRLEMSFMREIGGWGDLQASVRQHLVRSCSQHVPERAIDLSEILRSDDLQPIAPELRKVCDELGEVRKSKGGKKTYHLMVACYFRDLAQVWHSLRRVCSDGATVCFVIGDSAPYGVYVPVIPWLGALAESAGFKSYRFERTRDRNVKWKNRKHRVPLQEGRLWVEG
jgi:DNA modification methylase